MDVLGLVAARSSACSARTYASCPSTSTAVSRSPIAANQPRSTPFRSEPRDSQASKAAGAAGPYAPR